MSDISNYNHNIELLQNASGYFLLLLCHTDFQWVFDVSRYILFLAIRTSFCLLQLMG